MPDRIKKTMSSLNKLAVACCVAVAVSSSPVLADEMVLPGTTEVQYYSPEGQQFYAAGVAALHTADYLNAYAMLAKAAALQPGSVSLNRIVARLATYHGRQTQAEDSRDFYETAIHSLENVLRSSAVAGDLRREVTNELKLAQQERDNLAQRDVLREAAGTAFILDWNKTYAVRPEKVAGEAPATTAATSASQSLVNPLSFINAANQGMQQQQGMGMPGQMPGMMQPGMMPAGGGFPGPGGMPGQPGMAPGAAPNI